METVAIDLPTYESWKYVPFHLFDEAGLASMRLAPSGPASAVLTEAKTGRRAYLYSALAAQHTPCDRAPAGSDGGLAACADAACAPCRRRSEFHQAYLDAEAIVTAAKEGRLYALDTETTGLDETAEVIEIGVVSQRAGIELDSLVRPLRSIPAEATAVNGIADADVATAPTWPQVAPLLAKALQRPGATVVAWNAPFDARILRQTNAQAGLDDSLPNILCAMQAYAILTGERRNRISLQNAARTVGVLSGAQDHRSASDALLTLRVIERLAQRF